MIAETKRSKHYEKGNCIMSIYTETLKELAKWSGKIDNAMITENDFVVLQRKREQITEQYNRGYFNMKQRNILRGIAEQLVDDARDVLRVNEEVKAIEREIRKQRLAELRSAC